MADLAGRVSRVSLWAHLTFAVVVTNMVTCFAQSPPRVLVDLSHEFSFRYDIFGGQSAQQYWTGAIVIDKTSTFASLTPELLDEHDLLVVSQAWTNVAFSSAEMDMIRTWVSSGGGLWIAANKRDYSTINPGAPYPLQTLAELFGTSFLGDGRSGAYRVLSHAVTQGVADLKIDEGSATNLLRLQDPAWEVLISDQAGQPVIAARKYGQGRIVAAAQDGIISNPYQNPQISNVTLIHNIVGWLSETRRGNRSRPVPYRVLPENKVPAGLVDIYYPSTIAGAPDIAFMKSNIGPLIGTMQRDVLGIALALRMWFVALAGAGGGYSGGAEIGIGVDPAMPAPGTLLVMAHELTHSFDTTGGPPPEWMHGWPSLVAIRVARLRQYGGQYQVAGDDEYKSRVQAYRSYEEAHGPNSLDITEVTRGKADNAWAIAGKLFTMIETLEGKYGSDFMSRYYRIKRHYGAGQPTDTPLQIHWLSLAAGDDLFGFFTSAGTTIEGRLGTNPVVYSTTPASTDPDTWTPLAAVPKFSSDAAVDVVFNTDMDPKSADVQTVAVQRNGQGVPFTATFRSTRELTVKPVAPFAPCDSVTVRLQPGIRDARGNPLDGNGNGVNDGSNDAYVLSFTVAASVSSMLAAPVPGTGGAGAVQVESHCPWTASTTEPWIQLQSSGGTAGGRLLFTMLPNTTGQPRTGTILVDGQPVTVSQAAIVSGAATVASTGIVNAASYSASIAPSSFVSIFGDNLADGTLDWSSAVPDGRTLPVELGGVRVRTNGQPAYVAYISSKQLNVLLPPDIAAGLALVEVTTAREYATGIATVATYSPGFFTFPLRGKMFIAAHVANSAVLVAPAGALSEPSRPAAPGDLLELYATGLGPTNPPYPPGQVLGSAYPLPEATSLEVRIAGVQARVLYAGMTFAGLYQINIQVPPDLPDGDLPVVLRIAGQDTQPNAVLSFQK